ncbi:helix-turn-helix transcriptional regulator [Halobium palmae]|uniref:Helix-turn-helix transcriptional regulator n=1 Tax=Halobium palmae TaxID=1776492 RepID=A0ABD5S165_9EURY
MTYSDPDEVMAAVARRGDVLRILGEGGAEKRDLVAELDVSRSTVDRAVRELEGTGLVERAADGYRRTLAGKIALDEYRQFADRIRGVKAGRELLAELSPDTPFDAAMLEGGEIVRPERHSPHLPVNRLSELVERAERVRAFASAVFPQQVDTYHRAIVQDGMEARLVVTRDVVDRLVAAYREQLAAALDTGRLAIRATEEALPYSLVVADTSDGTEVGQLVYAEEGGVKGFIGNDGIDAVEWAEREIARRWERGAPLPVPEDV